jgi:hypothetical protein
MTLTGHRLEVEQCTATRRFIQACPKDLAGQPAVG